MKKVLVSLFLMMSTVYATEYKVVFDLRSGSADVIQKQVINNIKAIRKHYAKSGDTLSVAVVLSGGSYPFFKKSTKEKHEADVLSKLSTIEVCSMGLKKRKIAISEMRSFVIPAFNRTEALIRYQNRGYAYILVK